MVEVKWVDVFAYGDLGEDDPQGVLVGEHYIALFRINNAIYAVSGHYTHEIANLCDGYVDGDEIECPLHQARFHIPTGRVLCEPAQHNLAVYPVEIRNGRVLVQVPDVR